MNESGYISKQIAVYKTDKKLVELNDKLNVAPLETYAHIHAQGDETGSNRRLYSNIGIVIQDYSKQPSEATLRATANLSPEETQFIFSRAKNGVENFDFKTDKIFGMPDANGYAQVTKLVIKRASIGSDGAVRKYPWYIEVENGKGIPQKTKIGGTYCQKNSFVSEVKIFANLSDLDFFKLFCRADQYIMIWELTTAPGNIRTARKVIEDNMQTASN